MSNYPPGVTDQNFDELCWGETYRLGRVCTVCHEPLPDQADDEFCSCCESEEDEIEEVENEST